MTNYMFKVRPLNEQILGILNLYHAEEPIVYHPSADTEGITEENPRRVIMFRDNIIPFLTGLFIAGIFEIALYLISEL